MTLRIPLTPYDTLVISHTEFKGKQSVNIRKWTTYPDRTIPIPTKAGVNIKYGEDLDLVITELLTLQEDFDLNK